MKNIFLALSLFIHFNTFAQQNPILPQGFVDVKDYIPSIAVDLKYYSNHNFIGIRINGYENNRVILTKQATLALLKIEQELNKEGLGIKIFDAYRPQSAVNHFKKWAKDVNDTLMRKEFYPNINKKDLFKLGFIASKSGHSRGSTIDLTIIDLKTKNELDMGSPFDFFGDKSAHSFPKLSKNQKQNRLKLKTIMQKHGFKAYDKEWWHYTLINEPYQKTYYNFPIK